MKNSLDLMLSTNRAVSQDGRDTEIHSNIGRDSVGKIRELVRTVGAERTLEVGMASAFPPSPSWGRTLAPHRNRSKPNPRWS